MKKVVSLLLALLLVVALAVPAFAAEPTQTVVSQEIQRISDDAYVIITLTQTASPALTRAGTYVQAGSRNYTYVLYDTVQWSFAVGGEFTVNPGVSVVCTKSGYSFSPYVGGWSLSYGTSSKNGATASASGTVVGPKTVYPAVSLSCDVNGNLY